MRCLEAEGKAYRIGRLGYRVWAECKKFFGVLGFQLSV